jgi:hypothetical protein
MTISYVHSWQSDVILRDTEIQSHSSHLSSEEKRSHCHRSWISVHWLSAENPEKQLRHGCHLLGAKAGSVTVVRKLDL